MEIHRNALTVSKNIALGWRYNSFSPHMVPIHLEYNRNTTKRITKKKVAAERNTHNTYNWFKAMQLSLISTEITVPHRVYTNRIASSFNLEWETWKRDFQFEIKINESVQIRVNREHGRKEEKTDLKLQLCRSLWMCTEQRMRKERKKKVETKFYELHTEIIIKNTITTNINLK